MKTIVILAALVLFSACTLENVPVKSNDPFRETTNLGMFQLVKCFPDQPRYRIRFFNRNEARLDWSCVKDSGGSSRLYLLFGIETDIREDPVEPELYLMAGGNKYHLQPAGLRYENFTRNSTETTTTATTTSGSEKEGKKKETATSVSTQTSMSDSPRRYARLKFNIGDDLGESLVTADKLVIRFYSGDEGWICRFRRGQIKSVNRFMKAAHE